MTTKKPAKNVLHDLACFLVFVVVVVVLIPLVALTRKTIWATISPGRPFDLKRVRRIKTKLNARLVIRQKDDLFGGNISANKISFPQGQTSAGTQAEAQ